MEFVPEIVRSFVQSTVPASILDDIVLFRITNQYVKWNNRPQIVVITKHGEIIEFNNRQPVSSFIYEKNLKPDAFYIHFNKNKSHPAYIIKASDKVFIIGRSDIDSDDDDDEEDNSESIDINDKYVNSNEKMEIDKSAEEVEDTESIDDNDQLQLLAKFEDVTKLEDDDPECNGYNKLKLWRFDDLLPTILDSNYRIENRKKVNDDEENAKDECIMSILMENLREAKLNTARNRKILEKKQLFRRKVSHAICDDKNADADKCPITKDGEPWYKTNNGKLVIGVTLRNTAERIIEFMDLCLIDTVTFDTPSFELFYYEKNDDLTVHWKKCEGKLEADKSITVTCVTRLPEFSSESHNFSGFLHYKHENDILFAKIDIDIKASEIIQDLKNPILCNIDSFSHIDVLAILVTTVIKNLEIRFINNKKFDLKKFLIEKLEYECNERILPNILKSSKPSLHLLHGTVLYIDKSNEYESHEKICISFINSDQFFLLINLIYDLIPTRIAILPCKRNNAFKHSPIYSKSLLTQGNSSEVYLSEVSNHFDHSELHTSASNLYEQMALISQHVDKCIEAMSASNLGESSGKVASTMEIDLLSLGSDKYKELWKKLHEKMMH